MAERSKSWNSTPKAGAGDQERIQGLGMLLGNLTHYCGYLFSEKNSTSIFAKNMLVNTALIRFVWGKKELCISERLGSNLTDLLKNFFLKTERFGIMPI